jgi:hypothetical protein
VRLQSIATRDFVRKILQMLHLRLLDSHGEDRALVFWDCGISTLTKPPLIACKPTPCWRNFLGLIRMKVR